MARTHEEIMHDIADVIKQDKAGLITYEERKNKVDELMAEAIELNIISRHNRAVKIQSRKIDRQS